MAKAVKPPTVYGTGLIALDLVISADPDTPVYGWAGGTCGNVLTILSHLEWDAYPIARFGKDIASVRVKKDMEKWGVRMNYACLTPKGDTPIITEVISKDSNGSVSHKFSTKCPVCRSWLPGYKPVTIPPIKEILDSIKSPQVFFFDRMSRGALTLAKHCREAGAVIIFEPAGFSNPELLNEAFELSHIIKYSSERYRKQLTDAAKKFPPMLEIQTLGSEGVLYKSRLPSFRQTEWAHLSSYTPKEIKDTCGSGDWTTAGIIHALCSKGYSYFSKLTKLQLVDGLNLGQALATWNCSFEGARGGMYRMDKPSIDKEIKRILTGKSAPVTNSSKSINTNKITHEEVCPSCGLH